MEVLRNEIMVEIAEVAAFKNEESSLPIGELPFPPYLEPNNFTSFITLLLIE